MVACTAGSAGLHHGPVHDGAVHLAWHRIADRVAAARVRSLVHENHAVRDQPFVGGDAVVGEGADDLAIVVAIIGEAVGFDHRPVGEVVEQQIGRVLDAMLLLRAGAAAERHVATAGDGVAADMLLRLDHDDRRARLARDDRRRQARGAGADHHDIRFVGPVGWERCWLRGGGVRRRQGPGRTGCRRVQHQVAA
jgi:hypothetical protein